jgi:hypothetical protein
MRFSLRRAFVAATFTVGLLTACASETPPIGDNPPLDDGGGLDATTKPPPPPTAKPDAPADTGSNRVCKANCTTDLECQQTCPPAPNGVNCCDKTSGSCYAAATCQTSSGGDGGTD